jgi:cytochrome c oxidase subunit 1
MATQQTDYATPAAERTPVVKLYLAIGLVVFAGLMLVGVVMRAAQGASLISLGPDLFYQLMTLHGAGMVGTAGLAALAVNWYFLSRYVRLNPRIFLAALILSLVAVAMIVGAIVIGKFAAAWTFLYPLPANPMGQWSTGAALIFVAGLLVLGVAFLLVYLDMGLAIVRRYGSIARALGLPMLFGKEPVDPAHPPTVVASAMVLIVNVAGIAVGAIVLVMTMLHLVYPPLAPDALLMKNLIFFFGHVFINATIYSAVIAVYEILPLYARRPWGVSRPFLAAWLAATLMVLAVYPHHLLMDFALPTWMAVMGQILSYGSGIPVLVVTAFGGLLLIYRSGIRWDAASSLLVLGLFGWAAGIIPAVIDGMISVNLVMHNTQWVPGHFHFYLLIGVVPMVLGFASYLCSNGEQGQTGRLGVGVFAVGSILLCLTFLVSGASSVPRRFAVHAEAWQWLGDLGALSGGLVLIGTLMIALPILLRLPRAQLAGT